MGPRAAVLLAVVACSRTPSPGGRGIDLPGEAGGVWWDSAASRLILTDETHHQLVSWTEPDGFTPYVSLPDSKGLGAIVGLPDGRLVVTSFGFGTSGGVFVIGKDKTVTAVPNLDPTRRRLGLALAPDGALFVTYVTKQAVDRGGIAELDLAGGEKPLVQTGLDKPVGIAASETTLYVTDQRFDALLSFARGDPDHPSKLVAIADPDLLVALPDHSLVVGSKAGVIYRVQGSTVTTLASGFEEVRGIAFDPARKKLFAVDRSATSPHQLHVVPLERL